MGAAKLEELFSEAIEGNRRARVQPHRNEQIIVRPKVLTIWQPWAWLIIHGRKRVENRKWLSHYRGPLLIHVGQGWNRELGRWPDYVRRNLDELEAQGLIRERPELELLQAQVGHVIGRVEFTGVRKIVEGDDDGFAIPGQWGWELANPQPFTPYARTGKQGLVDADRWVLREPETSLLDAFTRFYRGGMRKEEAPIIAMGEAMTCGELLERIFEQERAATLEQREESEAGDA